MQSIALNGATKTLHGTWSLDLDTGVEASTNQSDIWWEQETAVNRKMMPRNGAQIAYLGVMTPVDFNALSAAQLQALTYTSTPIVGDNTPANQWWSTPCSPC